MKIEIFDTHKNITSAVVSTNDNGMLSVMINMADKYRVCSYRGSSLNLLALDDTDGAIPKHVCFVVTPAECDHSQGNESEVVVIAESLSEETFLKGMHYENQCKEQHEAIFVPHAMLNWKQEAIAPDSAVSVPCTVYDLSEGRLHIRVKAATDDQAHEEASIAAAEMGCSHVNEIVVGVHE